MVQTVFERMWDQNPRVPVKPASVAVVIPCKNEAANLRELLPQLKGVVAALEHTTTLHIVDGHSTDETCDVAREHGVGVLTQRGRGYGGAVRTALTDLEADWIVTLDADCSHPPATLKSLLSSLDDAEIVIASRYVPHGYTRMPWARHLFSRLLNRVFRSVLSVPVRDMSSGYRAYRRAAIAAIPVEQETFAFLPEILLKAYTRGYRVKEVPFHYRPRANGKSNARVIPFGIQYTKLLLSFWLYRNSVAAADYDSRAFTSVIPLQRWWQRQRYRIISEMVGNSLAVLDVGCGSGQLLVGCPQIVGMDAQLNKLRFMRAPGRLLLRGSIFAIPLASESFETVVCSQVIEHVPMEAALDSLVRCLAPGGTLVLGTVDYGSWQWPLIERIYGFVHRGGYADEHITHYTSDTLVEALKRHQLDVLEIRYIAKAEIIIKARKRGAGAPIAMFTQSSLDRALVCPRDLTAVTRHADGYHCAICGSHYPIVDSIPDFFPRSEAE